MPYKHLAKTLLKKHRPVSKLSQNENPPLGMKVRRTMECGFISIAAGLSIFFLKRGQSAIFSIPHFSLRKRRIAGIPRANYFSFTAIAEISIRALLTKAAAWMVARAGLGSGITPL